MTWFPLFFNLEGRDCLVAGGGRTALQKAERLTHCGANVTLVSPAVVPELETLPVRILRRKVTPEDIPGAALVIDATGDVSVGEMLYPLCLAQNIPLNVVDVPRLCTVIFPAILERGRLTAAISTSGASPLAAAWVRDRVGEVLPESFEAILEQMAELRQRAKNTIPEQSRRAALLKICFTRAMELDRPLTSAETAALWKEEAGGREITNPLP